MNDLNIYKINNKNNILTVIFCSCIALIGVNTLNIQLFGYPIYFAPLLLLNIISFWWVGRSEKILVIMILSALVIHDFESLFETRFQVFLLFVGSSLNIYFARSYFLRIKYIKNISITFILTALVIFAIGYYRLIFGFDVAGSENPHGFFQDRVYPYLGVKYLNSTRNSDALYLMIALALAIPAWLTSRHRSSRLVWLCVIGFIAACLVFTLSRMAILYLIVAVGYVAFFKWRAGLKLVVVSSVVFASLSLLNLSLQRSFNATSASSMQQLNFEAEAIENDVIFQETLRCDSRTTVSSNLCLAVNAARSLVDVEGARSATDGAITYSNSTRVAIYLEALRKIIRSPFGYGFDERKSIGMYDEGYVTHSENLHIDFLLWYGWGYSIFIIFIVINFLKITSNVWRKYFGLEAFLLFSAVGLFSILNSPINLPLFWFALMYLIIINSKAPIDCDVSCDKN